VTTLVALALPACVAHPLNTFLVDSLLSGDAKDFTLNSYLPELEPLAAGAKGVHVLDVLSRGVGVILKLVFAFLYQEKQIPSELFRTATMIGLGGHSVGGVTWAADALTGFQQTDWSVNNSVDVYPGQATCKQEQGHSIWHEVSANGLLDLIYLCDYVNKVARFD